MEVTGDDEEDGWSSSSLDPSGRAGRDRLKSKGERRWILAQHMYRFLNIRSSPTREDDGEQSTADRSNAALTAAKHKLLK